MQKVGKLRNAREPRVMLGDEVVHADLASAAEAQHGQILLTRIAHIEPKHHLMGDIL
jgi:hypothetical protein